MSHNRNDVLGTIANLNTAAANNSVDQADRIRSAQAELLGYAGMQAIPLTPYATFEGGILRYSINLGASANTFYGVLCSDAVHFILYNESGEAWTAKTERPRSVAYASADSTYLPIEPSAIIKPSETIYVEVWQDGSRRMTPINDVYVLVGLAAI